MESRRRFLVSKFGCVELWDRYEQIHPLEISDLPHVINLSMTRALTATDVQNTEQTINQLASSEYARDRREHRRVPEVLDWPKSNWIFLFFFSFCANEKRISRERKKYIY